MRVYVQGVGVAGPGLGDWLTARAVLCGQAAYQPMDVTPASPAFLPPNERRRVSRTTKLALQVAHEAAQTAAVALAQISPVFASAWGDLEIMDRILTSLAQPERPVSPTHFHNSVHNAAAGYWAIGTGAPAALNAIAANRATFTAGLLEAATLAATEGMPALLVAYDTAPPPALRSVVPITQAFATALLLSGSAGQGNPGIDLELGSGAATAMQEPPLESLRQANPIAAALPLLRSLALGNGRVTLPYHGSRTLLATVRPGPA